MKLRIENINDLMRIPHLYKISETLNLSLKMGIFNLLGHKECTIEEIARQTDCDIRVLQNILDLLSCIELLNCKDNLYSNAEVAKRYLTDLYKNNLDSLLLFSSNSDYTADKLYENIVKHCEKPQSLDVQQEKMKLYMDAMEMGNRLAAINLARKIQGNGNKKLLDLGCGSGVFSVVACKFNKFLKSDCMDNQLVLEITRKKVIENGLENRIRLIGGDLVEDDFEDSYDYILLSNVLHFFKPIEIKKILQKCYMHLNPKGKVIINDIFHKKGVIDNIFYSLEWLSNDICFVSIHELTDILKEVGYNNVEVEEINNTLSDLIFGAKEN